MGMRRIVIDRDDGASRILRQGLRDLEVAAVLANADAIAGELLPADGVFENDVGEVALLDSVSTLALAVEHPDVANLGRRDCHLARRRWPLACRAHLQRLVNGGDENEPE